MASTDLEQRLREAIVAVLTADTQVQALCGRTTKIVRPWSSIAEGDLPVLNYYILATEELGGTYDTRRVTVSFTAWAEGEGAQSIANHLVERVELGLTWPLLNAQNVDAAPLRRTRTGVEIDREGSRGLARSDIDVELLVTK